MRYEERAKVNKVNKILKECWEEIDRRAKVDMSKWKKMRCSYYEDLGVNLSEVTQRLKRGERLSEELRNADRGIKTQEQYDRIVNSRYNKMYRTIRKEERAAYLKEDYNGRDQSMIARFRGGNEELGSRHWRPKDENKCRLWTGSRNVRTHDRGMPRDGERGDNKIRYNERWRGRNEVDDKGVETEKEKRRGE